MRRIRRFIENNNIKYKVGNYVICSDRIYPDIINYIGKIVKYSEGFYYVKFEYDYLLDYMKRGYETYGEFGIRPYTTDEIVSFATTDDIQRYEIKKTANKYNL